MATVIYKEKDENLKNKWSVNVIITKKLEENNKRLNYWK